MKLCRGFLVSSILAILISLSVISSFPSIKAVEAPPTQWSKEFISLVGQGRSVIQTTDGGYAIAGVTGRKFLLLKTNLYGDAEWSRTYGDGVDFARAYCVIQTSDGGYVLAGQHNGKVFNFVKTDSAGNMQWSKYYGKSIPESFWVWSLVQTSDGGYILAGKRAPGFSDWVVKIDESRNVQWNKTYGSCIVEADDGGFIIAGSNGLFKIDTKGKAQWNRTCRNPESLTKASDGGYLLAGAINGVTWLEKRDSHGNTQWSQSLGNSYLFAVAQARGGGYVVAGNIYEAALSFWGGQTARVVKTGESGNIEWTEDYPTKWPTFAYSIIATNDGGYVFTGVKGYGGNYGNGYVWLVKIGGTPVPPPPTVSILSPENKTYTVNHVSLIFTVSGSTSWIGYSLDAQASVTVTGNTTLSGLAEGLHSLTVYATDTVRNIGSSDTVHFTVNTTLPSISILSPENKTYDITEIPLSFTVNETASLIGYSIDGQANIIISGNTTLTGLPDGPHSLVVYATDTAGNVGASETIYFSIVSPPPDLNGEIFLITNWIFGGMIIVAVVGAALLVYFRKIRKTREKSEKIIDEGVM